MGFEYNTGFSVMSVQLFAAFQSKLLFLGNSHSTKQKMFYENIWKCWKEPSLKVLHAPVDAEGVSSLFSETALHNIFSIDWGSAKEPAVLKAALSLA